MRKTPIILPIMLFLFSSAALSEIQYVTDELRITLRNGPGNSNKIIKMLNSGAKLQILDKTEDGYSYVLSEDATEGWVRSQYLQDERVARDKVAEAVNKVQNLTTQLTKLKTTVKELSSKKNELQKQQKILVTNNSDLEKNNQHLNKVASRPIKLDNDNKKLKKLNVSLEQDLQRLTQENQVLKDRDSRSWFIAGAAVLIFGMLLGVIIPKIKFRKKSSWDF